MSDIYKIETYSETCAQIILESIERSGGRAVIRGWAVLTNHEFTASQAQHILSLVSRTSDDISADDFVAWLEIKLAA